ncbi:hypothetical protein QE152_g24733 [Popillia japonica]|uniref:Retrotransposon gag domain-containing protein n=1 Tax=Popillia japonica TaxID=7064 RepID=A0AAW1K4Y1_POPJA
MSVKDRDAESVQNASAEETFEQDVLINSTEQQVHAILDETPVEWERKLIAQERELLRKERELLERERRWNRDQPSNVHYHNNNSQQVIPEFNPGTATSLTATRWVRKVEAIAEIFKWDDKTLLFNAITKLGGAAKLWFDGIREQITNWMSFRSRIILDFPSVYDDADIHYELSKRRKRNDETYEQYVYHMKAVASKGDLNDRSVLKYIIGGIGDRELAKLLNF